MKKAILLTAMIIMSLGLQSYSQDSRAMRAARMSYNSAKKNDKKGNYEEAAREYEIVINTIPASVDSRRYLEIRLESLIKLVDIYFYKQVNINAACEYLQMYFDNMNIIRNQGTLRASDLLDYQRIEKEFASEHSPKCENYEGIDKDMENFKRKFEKEFE